MAFPVQFAACAGMKLIIICLTIVVICLINPRYVTTYISINYEIVFIYLVSALTLVYCLVSCIMYVIMYRSEEDGQLSLTNCSLTEVVFSTAGVMGWIIICGIGGNIAQRTILETGQNFGWLGGCAGVNTALFIGVLAIFVMNLINEKVLDVNHTRKFRPGSRVYH